MPPRLIPPDPHFAGSATGAAAERTVCEALRDTLPDDAALLPDLGVLDRATEHEIDLLVVWPGVGLAVVEVKSGHISRRDGAWYQGRPPNERRIDPVRQAQDSRHALTRWLARNGVPDAERIRAAHLVAFPHVTIPPDWQAPDAPRAVVLDRSDLADAAVRVRCAIEDHGAGHAPLTTDDADRVVDLLAAPLPSHTEALDQAEALAAADELAATAADHTDRVDRLTRDQAALLAGALRLQNRLRVVGAAGSGKTFLALETARRRARDGERVALLCYSRGLGRYLERTTATWPARERPAFVGLFHELPVRWGAAPGDEADSDDWERRLPEDLARLADAQPAAEKFDSVVVDEAQDFGGLWWSSLLRCLRDPERGGVVVFLDEAQHVFPRDGAVPLDTPPFVLDENLRSTKPIAQLFGAFSDDVVRPRSRAGAPVRVVDVPYDAAVAAADDAVEALLDEGWPPGEIALLTTGRRHEAQRLAVELGGGHAAYWDDFFAGTDVFYGHVLGFKGLERNAVVLAVNGFREVERARRLLYTGLSRARVLLVVTGPRDEIERIGGEAVRRRLEDAQAWVPVAH
jgi:hypothetical protein